jgi:hypothetical protein
MAPVLYFKKAMFWSDKMFQINDDS